MSEFYDLSVALDSHLEGMAGLPPVAWENSGFKPVKDTLYLRPTLLAGNTVAATLGSGGTDEHVGVYQIAVFGGAGAGKKEVLDMADLLADRFKPVTELTYNGVMVRCVNVSRGAGTRIDDRWAVFLAVNYLSFTTKR